MSYEPIHDNLRLYDEHFPNPQEIAVSAPFALPESREIPGSTARHIVETLFSSMRVVGVTDLESLLFAGYNGLTTPRTPEELQTFNAYNDMIGVSHMSPGLQHTSAPCEYVRRYRFVSADELRHRLGPVYAAGTTRGARIGVYSKALLAKVVDYDLSASRAVSVQAPAADIATARIMRFTPQYYS